MIAHARLHSARRAADRWARVRLMAEVMRDNADGPDGSCRFGHLCAAGFTEAEIRAYADDARAILSGRPGAGMSGPSPARAEAKRLVSKAKRIRARIRRTAAAAHSNSARSM